MSSPLLRLLVTLFSAALLSAVSSSILVERAHAASLIRLSDGRLQLTALGERMFFREEDAKNIGIFWPPYPCKPPRIEPYLSDWLNNPEVAECLNRNIPDEFVPYGKKSLILQISFAFVDGQLYPGPGKRVDQSLKATLYPGELAPTELPSPPLISRAELRIGDSGTPIACLAPVRGAPDALGYQAHGVSELPTAFYTLPATQRSGSTSRPMCVICGNRQSTECMLLLRSPDNSASLSLTWFDWDYKGPRASWALYDTAARKVADSIFSNRVSGEFQ